MRETWLIHLCTDWMGDDAWLWKLDCEFRQVQLRRRHAVAARHASCASTSPTATAPRSTSSSTAENQRGEVTTPGHATILLPSREHGAVRLPDPPGGARDLAERARRDLRASSRADDRRFATAVDGLAIELDGGVLRLDARPAREAQRASRDAMMSGLIDDVDRRRRPTSACA